MEQESQRTEAELNDELEALVAAKFILMHNSGCVLHKALEMVGDVLDKIKKNEENDKTPVKRKVTSRKLLKAQPKVVEIANLMLAEEKPKERRVLELINSANKAAEDVKLGITPIRMLSLWCEEIDREFKVLNAASRSR